MNLVKKISQAATGYGQAVQTMQDGGFLRDVSRTRGF